MILFKETRPATLDDVRWLRKNLGRRLQDSCLKALDPRLRGTGMTLSLIDGMLLAVAKVANNALQHANPKPTFLSLEVSLIGAALRIEFCHDGGAFEQFGEILENAGHVRHPISALSGRGLSIIGQCLQDLEYHPGAPNRLVGWRKLRRTRPRLLIVEKDVREAETLRTKLSQTYETIAVKSDAAARQVLGWQRIDVILATYDTSFDREHVLPVRFDQCPIPVVLLASRREIEEMRDRPVPYADQIVERPVSTPALIATVEIAIASYTRRLIHLANYFGKSAGLLLADELPRKFPGFDLEVLSGTASYGGGDFGLVLPGEGFTRLVLADVMGHGLKAKAAAIALSAIVRTLHYQSVARPDALLKDVSHIVSGEPAFTDIIGTLVVVDAAPSGFIEAASAGHPPAAVISSSGNVILPVTGPLPGLLENPDYRTVRHRLQNGDKIAIVTDGIDRQSSATAEFPQRLFDKLAKEAANSLAQLKQALEGWLKETLGPAPRDDWTLMIGEYCGTPAHDLRGQEKEPSQSAMSGCFDRQPWGRSSVSRRTRERDADS